MGGDGGSIPRRVELVRNKRERERAEKEALNLARWRHCALSQQPLRQPIVSCKLGRLYNKEAILEKLLDKYKYSSNVADHITRLKDVRVLHLTPFIELNEERLPPGSADGTSEKFTCPIMNLEMNGAYPFVYSWSCGCVVSKRAIDAVKDSCCLVCGKKLHSKDIILLNPETKEDKEIALGRLNVPAQKVTNLNYSSSENQINTSSLEELAPGAKRHSSSSTSEVTSSKKEKSVESEYNEISVQEDPNTSSVYKSLFTSCEEARNQPKAHWVTFNPLYFR